MLYRRRARPHESMTSCTLQRVPPIISMSFIIKPPALVPPSRRWHCRASTHAGTTYRVLDAQRLGRRRPHTKCKSASGSPVFYTWPRPHARARAQSRATAATLRTKDDRRRADVGYRPCGCTLGLLSQRTRSVFDRRPVPASSPSFLHAHSHWALAGTCARILRLHYGRVGAS